MIQVLDLEASKLEFWVQDTGGKFPLASLASLKMYMPRQDSKTPT